MKKTLLLFLLTSFSIFIGFNTNAQSQYDTLKITYDATHFGITLPPITDTCFITGANKAYMHSGAGTSAPGQAWQHHKGNWGMDDGLGQLSSTGVNQWEIKIHLYDYFSDANPPVIAGTDIIYGVGMQFRNENGTLQDGDDVCLDVFVRMANTDFPTVEQSNTTPATHVTATWVIPVGIDPLTDNISSVRIHPNPISEQATIRYRTREDIKDMKIFVFNTIGEVVRTLHNGYQSTGMHFLKWDGTNDNGQLLPNGMYYLAIDNGLAAKTHKLILTR